MHDASTGEFYTCHMTGLTLNSMWSCRISPVIRDPLLTWGHFHMCLNIVNAGSLDIFTYVHCIYLFHHNMITREQSKSIFSLRWCHFCHAVQFNCKSILRVSSHSLTMHYMNVIYSENLNINIIFFRFIFLNAEFITSKNTFGHFT